MKKIILISIAGAVLIALVFAVASFFARDAQVPTATSTPQARRTGLLGLFGAPASTSSLSVAQEDQFATSTDVISSAQNPLEKIFDEPVAGAAFAVIRATSTEREVLRFVERETGNIFEMDLATRNILRISNRTIPGIQGAVWSENGEAVALQYLADGTETVKTFAGRIASSTFEGFFLPDNIIDLAVSPDGGRIFYLVRGERGAEGFIASMDNSAPVPAFTSPLSEWVVQWTEGGINLVSKASAGVRGIARRVLPPSRTETTILSGIAGLTTNSSPLGTRILFSESRGSGVELHAYDVARGVAAPLGLATLPEKCAWRADTLAYCGVPSPEPRTKLPDSWYQGVAHFIDDIWQVNAQTGSSVILFSAADALEDIPFDIVRPVLNSDGTLLAFIDKTSGGLWLAELPPAESAQ